MVALRELDPPTGKRVVRLRLPVTQDFLATIAPDLGEIQLNVTRPYNGGTPRGVIYTTAGVQYETATPHRSE